MDAKHYELFHPERSVHQFAHRGQFKPLAHAALQRLPAALALEAGTRQLAARKAPGPCAKSPGKGKGKGKGKGARPRGALNGKAPLPPPEKDLAGLLASALDAASKDLEEAKLFG